MHEIKIKNAGSAQGTWMVSFEAQHPTPEPGDILTDKTGQDWRFRGYTFSPAGTSGHGLFWAILEPPNEDSALSEGDMLQYHRSD